LSVQAERRAITRFILARNAWGQGFATEALTATALPAAQPEEEVRAVSRRVRSALRRALPQAGAGARARFPLYHAGGK